MVPFIGFCNWRQGYLLPVFSFGYFHIPNELAIVIVKWEYFWYFKNYVPVASICYTCSKLVMVVPLVAFTQIIYIYIGFKCWAFQLLFFLKKFFSWRKMKFLLKCLRIFLFLKWKFQN
jgi:hypothetical protein